MSSLAIMAWRTVFSLKNLAEPCSELSTRTSQCNVNVVVTNVMAQAQWPMKRCLMEKTGRVREMKERF